MIDLYADDMTLTEIQRKDKEVLVFNNKEKDESVMFPVSDEELLNIYHRVRMRCETLDLIKVQSK
jgi:hypothetical protein